MTSFMSDMVGSDRVSDVLLLLLFATVCQLLSCGRNGSHIWCALPGCDIICRLGLLVADLGSTSGPRNVVDVSQKLPHQEVAAVATTLFFIAKLNPCPTNGSV